MSRLSLSLAVASFATFAVAAAATSPAASADRLVLADGRVVEGNVVKDGDVYRVSSRFGEAQVAAAEVKEWVKAKSLESEWRERLMRLLPSDYAGRADLAKWLEDNGRETEAR